MDNDVEERARQSKARDYVLIHTNLDYDQIIAHAERQYTTQKERKAFVDAVLHADVAISNERAKSKGVENPVEYLQQ